MKADRKTAQGTGSEGCQHPFRLIRLSGDRADLSRSANTLRLEKRRLLLPSANMVTLADKVSPTFGKIGFKETQKSSFPFFGIKVTDLEGLLYN